jgi:hypothetical protein
MISAHVRFVTSVLFGRTCVLQARGSTRKLTTLNLKAITGTVNTSLILIRIQLCDTTDAGGA